jgi:tetratricopeptide (TPR) repeat protein
LHLLQNPLPDSSTKFAFGLVSQVFNQALHRYFPSRYSGSVKQEEREAALDVARLYELMGRIYFYSNETLPIMYCILHFLNTAETAGPSPELASSYAGMAMLAGLAQLHPLANTYVDRALTVACEVNQLPNQVTVRVVSGAYKVGVGKWAEVREMVEEAKAICEQLGDMRQWGDCAAMLGENAFISGDLHYSLDMENTLLEDARRRRSPLHLCWGLLGVAVNYMRFGKIVQAIPLLEEALQILEETPNLASSIENNGQLALALFRLGEDEKALVYAGRVLELSANVSPTVYSLNIGFSASADIYFELWERALQDPTYKAAPNTLKQLAEKSLKLIHAFQKVFPIGQPTTAYYRGWHQWLTGKHQAAIKTWEMGLRSAQKLNMPYEEGLLHLKLGSHLPHDSVDRRRHLERAMEIFEKMGVVRELGIARTFAETVGK